ncbi:protein C activator-like [Copidosoma floridanum]|uniref:protein C activator-like n=1 Tax=Copidosoma floridanum TaxID=29053 RepID=UPI0006C9BA7E|nr:protein C activator-like [Copidosoma floridanum]
MAQLLPIFVTAAIISIVAGLDSENIIGGQNANLNGFKYQVFILVNYKNGGASCGGALIHRQFILTSTSCITVGMNKSTGLEPNTVYARVHLGTDDLESNTQGGKIRVKEIYIHKYVTPVGLFYSNDIVVLKLETPVSNHLTAGVVKLPKSDEPIFGGNTFVSGFGYNSIQMKNRGGQLEPVPIWPHKKLKYAKVNVIPLIRCEIPKDTIKKERLMSTLFCGTIMPEPGVQHYGSCYGDGGSPLVRNGEIIGILTRTWVDCDESRVPVIYTKVTGYLYFINNILEGQPGPETKKYVTRFPPDLIN